MFSSTILDVVIGVVFGFLAVSLAAGAVVEAFNSYLKTRSGTLLKAVKDLVNDPKFSGIALQLYQHALVNPRGPGAPANVTADEKPSADAAGQDKANANAAKNAPAYIDPAQFAEAFIDILSRGKNAAADAQEVAQALSTSPFLAKNPQMRELVDGIVRRAQGDMNEVKAQLAHWFDSSMDRVSGVFKRWMQLWTFIAALIIAVLFNVDALRIAQLVWQQPALVDQLKIPGAAQLLAAGEKKDTKPNSGDATAPKLAAPGDATAPKPAVSGGTSDPWAALTVLDDRLPLGWPKGRLFQNADGTAWEIWPGILGWLITAVASLFGAPFWFDLLQKAVRLKGAGPSPDEKKTGKAAAS